MRLPEQPGEGKPENVEKGGRGAPGGGEEPPRSQAPDFPTWQVFSPKTPWRNELFQVFAQDLIIFSPQVGGGEGAGSLCCQVSGGRGDPMDRMPGRGPERMRVLAGAEILLYVLSLAGFH